MTQRLFGVGLLVCVSVASAAEPTREGLEFFEKKIRPVLVDHCYQCHSAKAAASDELKGGLLVDSRKGMLQGGESGSAVVPGKPDEGLLIGTLRHESFEMPPKGKLPDEVIADFVKWIEMGAPDPREGATSVAKAEIDIEAGRQHWAFQPLSKAAPPNVKDAAWVRTPIDRFVRARQEAASIQLSAPADAHALVRRTFYDLLGLPPSPEELDRWVGRLTASESDKGAAYEQLVDHLLASEHYGERWARHWLDLARFAESNGYAFDKDRRNAYHYRDFVIQALNSDMPYDEFVRQQIAGDLLTNINASTRVEARQALQTIAATGYVVAGPFTTQQTQKERERSRYEQLDDMVNTLGTSLLGLTLGCCRCHSHKYDPLPMYDYYRMASCFSDVGFSDTGINLEPEAFRQARDKYDAVHTPLVAARTKYEQQQLPAHFEKWLQNRSAEAARPGIKLGAWQHVGPFQSRDFNAAFAEIFPPETEINLSGTYPDKLGESGDGETTLKWSEQPKWVDGEAHNDKLKGNNCANYLFRVIEAKQPTVLALSLGSDDGIKVWVNGRELLSKRVGRNNAAADQEKITIQLAAGRNDLLMKIVNSGGTTGFYFQSGPGQVPGDVAGILNADPDKWNDQQRRKALDWFKGFDAQWMKLGAPIVRHQVHEPKPDLTPVYAAKVRGTTYQFGGDTYKVYHVRRGNPDNKESEASPGFLRVLIRTDEQETYWLAASGDASTTTPKPARIALADWLTDTEHGAGHLLARVLVNRLWLHHLGRGIVATPSDFGTRGEPPSHPELLDWLAAELIRGGWQLKPIHRLIMTSAVYRQGGGVTETGRRNDPENLLFWRRASRRMEAEVIRDALLSVSDTLDTTMYGPGTLDQRNPRRSIYLTVKRSQLIPMLQLFDAPDAMQGTGSRQQSTVAPQALTMLNSPMVRDWATKFSQRVRPTAETSLDDAVTRAYRIAFSRPPTDRERTAMIEFIARQTDLRGGAGNAEQLAVRDFCHLVLCMNEFVYVD